MARFKDKQRAIELRKEGKSYSQIKEVLKVSKSTLSLWLRDYPLSTKRMKELRDYNEVRIEKYRETRRIQREERLKVVYNKQKEKIFPLNQRDLFLSGLFLYLGEGSKFKESSLALSNTDPSTINFFIKWLIKSLKIPKKKIRVYLHLYKDMNINKEMKLWSRILDIPLSQFNNPYIKKTNIKKVNHRGSFGHGTCNIFVGDARLTEEILMGLKVIKDKFKRT